MPFLSYPIAATVASMIFADTLTLDRSAIRYRPSDGAAIAEVPVARTGIQDYAGWEVGRPDLQRVSVYRPPETVFDDEYIASMAHRPITDDHPPVSVDTGNWREYSRGHTGETVRKDEASGLVYVPMMISDQGLIDKLAQGKREVSCGYTCDLEWKDGQTPDGTPFQAIQKNARINHIAVVKRGRAGSTCRIGDSWAEFNDKEPSVATKTVKIEGVADGMPFEVTDAAETIINRLVSARDALAKELKNAQATEGTLTATVATKDGEIAALKAKLADAEMTPAKLAKMVADRAKLVADAKKIDPDADEDDDEATMKRKAVAMKMGDAAASLSDAAIDGAFAVYAAAQPTTDSFRETVKDGVKSSGDADAKRMSARDAYLAELTGKKDK